MLKHRRLFWSLAFSALVGLMATEARAETITMTIVANGTTITITNQPIPTGSPVALVNPPTSSQLLSIDTGTLNTLLAGAGSHYQFTDLGVASNWAGTTGPAGAFLKTTGTITLAAGQTPDATPLSVRVTEDGFTAPVGPNGVLTVTANANYAGAPAGSNQFSQGSYNTTTLNAPLPSGNLVSSGVVTNNPRAMETVSIGTTTTGFTLDNFLTFNLLTNPTSNAADGFAVTAQVNAGVVPEPASLVLMLTSMPLPLVVVGLLRRRRRAAA
jgi:hypothetical protein